MVLHHLLTIEGDERTFRWAGRETDDQELKHVLRGRIFLGREVAGGDRIIAVDRAGRPLSGRLPGFPAALSDHYAMFTKFLKDGTRSYSIYRLA